MTDPDPGCGEHGGLPAELRAIAVTALDRLAPVLDRIRAEPATAVDASTCAGCPVCAVLAALRGERPELARRLAEQAAAVLAVLRAALEEGGPPARPARAEPATEPASAARIVQRIPVRR